MLKRHRPVSPAPCIADVSLSVDHRDAKRRRTAPPLLDGRTRGWGDPQSAEIDSDAESTESEEEQSSSQSQGRLISPNSEYKSVNSFLNELHTLHRHRLLFSQPDPQQTPFPSNSPLRCPKDSTAASPLKGRSCKTAAELGDIGNTLLETQRVSQRYEDTNKLLGSLFLSRRKERSDET
ncbi:hypothetical protein C8J56DRAFT_314471 [Mycena floridula]|nr:hypothetical protein C8J56DRAFT_314471 [Mycena floridula]